ncbi:hypothetical protein [Burkholderia guangdongensis]|uniref:hypothetical protein n=1 Tax=Burkholderia guangdongensis TaxID=1792500 RepID=UPI0015C92528|nr:hypothetical protein [Burkholderia guangdongensis]
MTQLILERRDALAATMRHAGALAWRRAIGAAITGSGAAVLIGQAVHHLAGG